VNHEDGEAKEILASGDETGQINLWSMKDNSLKLLKVIEPYGDFPVTTMSIWNRIAKGVVIAGYGSGHIRIFSIPGTGFFKLPGHSPLFRIIY
jgi:hypothetical protein